MDARDTTLQKAFDIAIQMTLEHVNSEIQENRNGRKKQLLTKTHKCSKQMLKCEQIPLEE